MSTIAYKCPNCASPLIFDGDSGRMICRACQSQFEPDVIQAMFDQPEEGVIEFEAPNATYDETDLAQMQAYNCKNCGAALITEGTTTATECPYCGSPTVLPDRIAGGIRPEKVVPFVITKEQAQKSFEDYFKGKKLLPNLFKTGNRIKEIRKLFVPYWLFDCDANGSVLYDAQKRKVTKEGEWEIETIEHYLVRRMGTMSFINIPVDGSEKLENKITESLEPYDFSKAVDFKPAVLSGAMADHADVDAKQCESRAIDRVKSSISNALRGTVSGYTSVTERSKSINAQGGKVTPVLLPVWLITTVKDSKTYTFAINGQTGKLTCDIPTDKGKAFLWGAGVFAGVTAVAALVLKLLNMLESGTLLMAGLAGMFVALGVVFTLIGQLKQAAVQAGASGYARDGGLQLQAKFDCHLYTKTNRKKIETQKQSASA